MCSFLHHTLCGPFFEFLVKKSSFLLYISFCITICKHPTQSKRKKHQHLKSLSISKLTKQEYRRLTFDTIHSFCDPQKTSREKENKAKQSSYNYFVFLTICIPKKKILLRFYCFTITHHHNSNLYV